MRARAPAFPVSKDPDGFKIETDPPPSTHYSLTFLIHEHNLAGLARPKFHLEEIKMKNFRRFSAAILLAAAFSVPALAGEMNSPPCPNPGETNSPPCTAPGETSGPPGFASSGDTQGPSIAVSGATQGPSATAPGETQGPSLYLAAILFAIQSAL
jgi:hypothetical protein